MQHNFHECFSHKRSGIPNGRAWPIELYRLNRRPGKTKNNGSFLCICNQNNRFRLCDSDCDWDCRWVHPFQNSVIHACGLHLIAVGNFPDSNTSLVFSYKFVFVLFYQSTIDVIKQIKNPSFEHWCSSSIKGVTGQIVEVKGKKDKDRQRNKWSFLVKTILVLFLENTVREVEGWSTNQHNLCCSTPSSISLLSHYIPSPR
jgi:hypothetical protein